MESKQQLNKKDIEKLVSSTIKIKDNDFFKIGNYLYKIDSINTEQNILVLIDETFNLKWVYVPLGNFVFGLSEEEKRKVLELSQDPFLTFEEMTPSKTIKSIGGFLVLQQPLTLLDIEDVEVTALDTVGIEDVGIFNMREVSSICSIFDSRLPTEEEWEYFCRCGNTSLFWFGDRLPKEHKLEQILGFRKPVLQNEFGIKNLFMGEICSSAWKNCIDGIEIPENGNVIRGGSSRFWPWHDSREWAGCVSAFRMPSVDIGDAGVAIRLIRSI